MYHVIASIILLILSVTTLVVGQHYNKVDKTDKVIIVPPEIGDSAGNLSVTDKYGNYLWIVEASYTNVSAFNEDYEIKINTDPKALKLISNLDEICKK